MNPYETHSSIQYRKCNNVSNEHIDSLMRIDDELVEIGYAMHPQYYWDVHKHERHQFILILDESASAELSWVAADNSRKSCKLTGRNLCFIERNMLHSFRWDAPAALVSLCISDAFMKEITIDDAWNGVVVNRWCELMNRDLLALALAKVMAELCRQHDSLHPTQLKAAGTLLGAQLVRIHSQKKVRLQKQAGLPSEQLERVQKWITDHLSERLIVRDLGRVAGMSKDHFGRKFKASTGYPPHQFILIERLNKALELLKKGELRTSEVAAVCGFSDQSHLSRSLRMYYGQLLLEKKRQQRRS